MSETIGIIGLGDLGGRLTLQAESAGLEVLAYEPHTPRTPREAVDSNVVITGLMWPPKQAESVDAVLEDAATIHWCAPSSTLPEIELGKGQTLVLHDSVMNSSRLNSGKVGGLGRMSIAHCLMNPEVPAFAFVAEDTDDSAETVDIFTRTGIEAEHISVDEHDRLMAHSQARLAWGVLFDLPVLRQRTEKHLTKSGSEYREALTVRAAAWTLVTLRTIFKNPYIPEQERITAIDEIDRLESLGYTSVHG